MRKIASFIQRRTALILIVSLVLTLLGSFYTIKLFQNLRTDIEELLPISSRSVQDLDQVAMRLRSIDNIAILVFSQDTEASKRLVIDLANELEKYPKDEVAYIEYRIDRELEFFRKRSALYADTEDLLKIRSYIRDRLSYETNIRNPLNIFSGENIPEPELDFRSLRNKYENRAGAYARFPEGFFATSDQTKRVILIDVPGKTLGPNRVRDLKHSIAQTIERLNPRSYAPDVEVHYAGNVEEMLEEQDALVEDLVISTIVVILLVAFSILAFFRSFAGTAALVLSVLAATLWTFGISYFVVGYLNANSAFLGSIVLGNGENFGIIFLARYLEERRRGRNNLQANLAALRLTPKATFTAALAAGLSYGSLMLTSFRGFNQFGIIGLIGMVLCWLSAYTLLPALLSWFERLGWLRARSRRPERRSAFLTNAIARLVSRYPGMVVLASTALTVASALSMTHAGTDLFETHLDKLRSRRSIESGAGFYTQYNDEIFQRFLSPVVVLPSTRQHSLEIASRLRALKRKEGPGSPIISVQTIDDFVPKDQERKIEVLKEIRSMLKPRIVAKLSSEERERARLLLSPEAFHPISVQDVPLLIREKFKEKDGTVGKLVLVEPPLSRSIWEGGRLGQFIEGIRHETDAVEKGAPVAGGMVVSSDLLTSISRDGPRATLVSLLAVVILVVVLFRDPKTVALSLFALFVGIVWFGGALVGLAGHGFKINFLNFVVLPITFGIGVDYGVNVFQRLRQRSRGDITQVIRETGGAVGLSSFTTIIGYSSLLMASNQGFVSFGLLAVLGEISCVTAALVALPAVLVFRGSISRRVPRPINAGPALDR